MRTTVLAGLFIAILITTLFSCAPNAKLYRSDNKKHIYTGQLSSTDYTSLKQLLASNSKTALQDTLIIRYDYNYETCWNTLDQQDDANINRVLSNSQNRVQEFRELRPNISVFEFKETGKYLNKLKKWIWREWELGIGYWELGARS